MTEYKIYMDSNVFISCARQEINGILNLRFLDTENFFSLCKKLSAVLVLSKPFFEEVEKTIGMDSSSAQEFVKEQGIAVELPQDMPEYRAKADELGRRFSVHFPDSLHLAIAAYLKCAFLVSWNKRDFSGAQHFLPCLTPAEFVERFL